MKISVVAPLYKSAPYIEALYRRCVDSIASIESPRYEYEIIFVNDGSPDDGVAIARRIATRDSSVVVIDLARNYGHDRAVMVGLQNAGGDLVFVLDSDLEDEPEWIVRFLEEMLRTGSDVVYGVQSNRKRGLAYRMGRRLFFTAMRLLSDGSYPENTLNARLMTRRYVDAVLQFKEREISIDGIWHMCGFSQVPLKVIKYARSPTSYTTRRLLSIVINGITSFSTRPLIAIAIIGAAMCLLAFTYTALIVVQRVLYGVHVDGWASIMAAVLTIGGLTIFCNGVIAIYIAKIFLEVKQRPLAIVKEVYQGNQPLASLATRLESRTDDQTASIPGKGATPHKHGVERRPGLEERSAVQK
jgi:putative glycosyltransferase